jgi:hypothetical protein
VPLRAFAASVLLGSAAAPARIPDSHLSDGLSGRLS